DGLGLAELVKKKEVKPAEVVEAALERIERHNPQLNAVVFKAYDEARAMASAARSGPFAGVPMLLKDILGFKKGWPNRSGSGFVPALASPFDSTLVLRFQAAGLIPLGKTNAPELGLLPLTEPKLYGAAHNPWNLGHSTGGSSGGSAAAVAAGIVPLAHANDGGGSIRIPASCCGLVGLKPTRGRNPLGPAIGDIMGGLVAEHVVSRSVRDSAAVLDATAGPEIGDPYAAPPPPGSYLEATRGEPKRLRIAFTTRTLDGEVDPECKAATEAAAKLCATLGHHVEEGRPQLRPDDEANFPRNFTAIWSAGLAMTVEFYGKTFGKTPAREDFEGLTWGLYQLGKTITAAQYLLSWAGLQAISRQVARWQQPYDAWITPVLGRPPLEIGAFNGDETDVTRAFAPIVSYVPFTPWQNVTGQPAISLPLARSTSGLPIGIQFVGRFGEEHLLLQLAAQIERAQPWSARPPIYGS
ncbi:MAG: amidase family protein, partial [Alphaproteobacteria bacterium]|nr:amidase family protein [Alphaproteobacteria bacterium]